MTEIQPPWALENVSSNSAKMFRQSIMALLGGVNVGATVPLGGVHPSYGGAGTVTQAGTPNMSVLVPAFLAVVPAPGSYDGAYVVCNDGTLTKTIDAASTTQFRRDLIVAQVTDTDFGDATDTWAVNVIKGTNSGSSPAPLPSLPARSIKLAEVTVNPNVTSILNANINKTAQPLAAVGGMWSGKSANLPSSPPPGTIAWTTDTLQLKAFISTGWFNLISSTPIDWTSLTLLSGASTGGDGNSVHRVQRTVSGQVEVQLDIDISSVSTSNPQNSTPIAQVPSWAVPGISIRGGGVANSNVTGVHVDILTDGKIYRFWGSAQDPTWCALYITYTP